MLLKVIYASCPFDLSALNDINDYDCPIITQGSGGPIRPIGTKRPTTETPDEPIQPVKQLKSLNVIVPTALVVPTIAKNPAEVRIFSYFDSTMTPYDIIENELKFGAKLRKDRNNILRKTLQLIADNDLNGLKEHSPIFEATFGLSYSKFSRNKIKNYLLIIAILFGSHEVSDSVSNYEYMNWGTLKLLPEITRYLLTVQSYERSMITFFRHCSSYITDNDLKKELINIVTTKYPNLDFSVRYLLNCIGRFCFKKQDFFKQKNEVDRIQFLISTNTFDDIEKLQQFLLIERPEIYIDPEFSDQNRILFLDQIIKSDNVNVLTEFLNLYPDIIYYNSNTKNFDNLKATNIFQSCIRKKALSCLGLLLDLATEIFHVYFNHNYKEILSYEQVHRFGLPQIFNAHGINYEYKLKTQYREEPICIFQFCLLAGCSSAFEYYYNQAGVENAKRILYQFHGDDNEIVKVLIKTYVYDELIKRVTTDFGIDLNAKQFTFNGKRGNALIFLENNFRIRERALNLNISDMNQ